MIPSATAHQALLQSGLNARLPRLVLGINCSVITARHLLNSRFFFILCLFPAIPHRNIPHFRRCNYGTRTQRVCHKLGSGTGYDF